MICTLLAISFAPITKAESDFKSDSDDDMEAGGTAYASVWYTGTEIRSSHYTWAYVWAEGRSLACTSEYKLTATQVIGQFEPSIIEPQFGGGDGSAWQEDADNADSQDYYHSTSLSAGADLNPENKYRLTAYSRLTGTNKDGTLQVAARAVEEWGNW